MAEFATLYQSEYGRCGRLETPVGTIQTPALFPVANLVAGTTPESGGIWRYTRRELFQSERVQGIMFQAMSFLDYNLSPDSLDRWREQSLREHFAESEAEPAFNQPLFIDSGGFKLMNSATFGRPPEAGGSQNEWGIYTNPESILDLQLDYGGDIIATLDYPIPQNLEPDEVEERMQASVDNAVTCIELLAERAVNPSPGVYVAIHGHNYEDVHWYVSRFLDQIDDVDALDAFEGFALGSLVPLSNSPEVLVDIVQGAKDAIPVEQEDEIALHVFGISGRLCSLLALLGVDSFDSASYIRAARNKRFIDPETWKRKALSDIVWEDWNCDCVACRGIHFDDMRHALLESDVTYQRIEGEHGKRFKSEYYAEIAHHNFALYSRQMERIREAIEQNQLLTTVAEFAEGQDIVEKGLKRAQLHNSELREQLEASGYDSLVAGPDTTTFQSTLSGFHKDVDAEIRKKRTISLKYGPSDFNILRQNGYHPPENTSILLVLPCSQEKPYSESRTQQAVLSRLDGCQDAIHKISLSGLYGPVPADYEQDEQIMGYEYVLTPTDSDQIDLVADRLSRYLEQFGDQFEHIFAYTTNKAYRAAMDTAFTNYGRGEIYPVNPRALQLTEHFRDENINELVQQVEGVL